MLTQELMQHAQVPWAGQFQGLQEAAAHTPVPVQPRNLTTHQGCNPGSLHPGVVVRFLGCTGMGV